MFRKCLLLFTTAILLMLPCSLAEDAPEENLFLGVWEPLYYIYEGKTLTPEENEENPTRFTFTEDRIELLMYDGSTESSAYSLTGNTCTSADCAFILQHEDLIIGSNPRLSLSFLLVRIDPMVLNNPFIGTWIPLCAVKGDTVRTAADQFQEASAVFSANSVELIDGKHVDVYSCTYADGSCILLMDDERIVCTITEDGLLHMTYPVEGQIICAREGEVLPENTTQFFGEWREIAALRSGLLITDQMPQSQRPFENNWLFQYDFSRAAVLRSCPEHADNPSSWILCTYADGTCTILYDDMPVQCTIDENGLMCIRSEDGDVIWLVRVEEETDAEPAASE